MAAEQTTGTTATKPRNPRQILSTFNRIHNEMVKFHEKQSALLVDLGKTRAEYEAWLAKQAQTSQGARGRGSNDD
jgi:hypothetical protein